MDKQHGKRAQAVLKSDSQNIYEIHLSHPRHLTSKKSLLLTHQILGLLVNTCESNVEICVVAPLPYSLITAKSVELEKVSLIDMQHLGTAC